MPAKKWNRETVALEAQKYSSRRQFKLGSAGAYKVALKLGIVDNICAHMTTRNWSETEVVALASRYRTLKDFREENKGAYLSAMRGGYLKKVTANLERALKPRGYWTFDRCKEEAQKYQTRGELQIANGSVYNASLKNGWLDEVCSHMGRPADGYHHCVYAIINERSKVAYIGITRQNFKKRMSLHNAPTNTANSRHLLAIEGTKSIQLTDYIFEASSAGFAEKEWVDIYRSDGFTVLNDDRQLGRTGTNRRIHTDEMIFAEAQKYRTRNEFRTKSPKLYDAAVSQRILAKACAHMPGIAAKNTWTKSACIAFARTLRDRSEFVNASCGAYDAALRNGWLEEIYAVLRSRDDMSWLRPTTRKAVWSKADQFYEIWIEAGKCGTDRMRSLTGVNLEKMIAKFKRGWVPQNDQDWLEWRDEVAHSLLS